MGTSPVCSSIQNPKIHILEAALIVGAAAALAITLIGGLSFYSKTQLIASPGNWLMAASGGIAFAATVVGLVQNQKRKTGFKAFVDDETKKCIHNFLIASAITCFAVALIGGFSFYSKTQLVASPGNWYLALGGSAGFVLTIASLICNRRRKTQWEVIGDIQSRFDMRSLTKEPSKDDDSKRTPSITKEVETAQLKSEMPKEITDFSSPCSEAKDTASQTSQSQTEVSEIVQSKTELPKTVESLSPQIVTKVKLLQGLNGSQYLTYEKVPIIEAQPVSSGVKKDEPVDFMEIFKLLNIDPYRPQHTAIPTSTLIVALLERGVIKSSDEKQFGSVFEIIDEKFKDGLDFSGLQNWEKNLNTEQFTFAEMVPYCRYNMPLAREGVYFIQDEDYKKRRESETGQKFFINAVGLGFNRASMHIITQGPKTDTEKDFWQMVWESDAHICMNLTEFKKDGVEKCSEYFYRDAKNPKIIGDDEFKISCAETLQIMEGCYIYKLLITKKNEENPKKFTIIHDEKWPDQGNSDIERIYQVMRHLDKELEAVSLLGASDDKDLQFRNRLQLEKKPIIVHCSAGLGRSCTWAAMDMIIKIMKLAKSNDTFYHFDFYKFVQFMRMPPFGRLGAVQKAEQYYMLKEFAFYCQNQIWKN